jgi:hypothetical protein
LNWSEQLCADQALQITVGTERFDFMGNFLKKIVTVEVIVPIVLGRKKKLAIRFDYDALGSTVNLHVFCLCLFVK